MAKAGGDDDDMIVEINVTPLVDVVLVLLIIFMVTARLMVSPTIPVELPKASTGEDASKNASPLAITLSYAPPPQATPMFLNGQPIERQQLELRIQQEILKQKKNLQVIIAADQRVTHGKVMALLDMLRRLGVEQYAFNIDPGSSQP